MKRSALILSILFISGFLLSGHPAFACLNDREVEAVEREFKSKYNNDTQPVQVHRTRKQKNTGHHFLMYALAGLGFIGLTSGGAMVLFAGFQKTEDKNE